MKTEKTTISQELEAIIRASKAAKTALESLAIAYEKHLNNRGDRALNWMPDAINDAKKASRWIDDLAKDAQRYKSQIASHGNL